MASKPKGAAAMWRWQLDEKVVAAIGGGKTHHFFIHEEVFGKLPFEKIDNTYHELDNALRRLKKHGKIKFHAKGVGWKVDTHE